MYGIIYPKKGEKVKISKERFNSELFIKKYLKMKKLIRYIKSKISNFKYKFNYLGVLNSPFVGLELKWYFGKIQNKMRTRKDIITDISVKIELL